MKSNHYISILATALLLLSIFSMPAFAADDCSGVALPNNLINSNEAVVRIAALHVETDTGKRHFDGIEEALNEKATGNLNGKIAFYQYTYTDKRQGIQKLQDLIKCNMVDIIIGPTESDIFVELFNREKTLRKYQVPVISGLATAEVANNDTSWFFRTNVNVTRRVKTIHDFLKKDWIGTFAVVYENTEFGRRAQLAFEEEMQDPKLKDRYTAYLYENEKILRKHLTEIAEYRPDAVGFFAEREHLIEFSEQLKNVNRKPGSYKPIYFTILDVRKLIGTSVDNIYFTSVARADFRITDNTIKVLRSKHVSEDVLKKLETIKDTTYRGKKTFIRKIESLIDKKLPTRDIKKLLELTLTVDLHNKDKNYGEVKELGYSTGLLVMKVLDDIKSIPAQTKYSTEGSAKIRQEFRSKLAAVMSNGSFAQETESHLIFNSVPSTSGRFENKTPLGVYYLNEGEIFPRPIPQNINLIYKSINRLILIHNIYGGYFYRSLFIIALLTILLVTLELRREFPQKHIRIYRTTVAWFYLASHFIIVTVLYIYLLETRKIRYDDIILVAIISMTPQALLKTTFFETRAGTAFGLEGFYKKLQDWISRMIMDLRYTGELGALTNAIAYSNSVEKMKSHLKRRYKQKHGSGPQYTALLQKMEQALNEDDDYFDRRRAAATLILKQFDRTKLKREGLVPLGFSFDKICDPKWLISLATRRCSKNEQLIDEIKKLKDEGLQRLKDLDEKRYDEVQDFLDYDSKLDLAANGQLRVNLRALLVLYGFRIDFFEENDLVNENDVDLATKLTEVEGNEKKLRYKLKKLFLFYKGKKKGCPTTIKDIKDLEDVAKYAEFAELLDIQKKEKAEKEASPI